MLLRTPGIQVAAMNVVGALFVLIVFVCDNIGGLILVRDLSAVCVCRAVIVGSGMIVWQQVLDLDCRTVRDLPAVLLAKPEDCVCSAQVTGDGVLDVLLQKHTPPLFLVDLTSLSIGRWFFAGTPNDICQLGGIKPRPPVGIA
jgi:hypothetical protein